MSYDSTLGRFLEPDPIGYVDGMNPYNFVRNNPVGNVDPIGLATTQPSTTQCSCWCTSNPEDCYLEYAPGDTLLPLFDFRKLAAQWDQDFFYQYKVSLKSQTGHSLGDCNLHQEARSTFTYLNAADAKPMTAKDFPRSQHVEKLKSQANGNQTVVTNPDDYVKAGSEFTDNPGFHRFNDGSTQGFVTDYSFVAYAYVEEAPTVDGWIVMYAQFNFANLKGKALALSGDGGVNWSR